MHEAHTNKGRKRGRPAGPKTVRVVALLYPEQKRDLEFLAHYMEGNPPVASLIREAVKQYVSRKLEDTAVRDAHIQARKNRLRVL